MKKHIKYTKIKQFRNVIIDIYHVTEFIGLNEAKKPIYDKSIKKPILEFEGTVKLHGTNSSISWNSNDGLWVQSKENIITIDHDNYGFSFFVEKNKSEFIKLINLVKQKNNLNDDYTITIYGEWAGKGIQKGVGISKIDKSLFIFAAKISKPQDEDFISYYIDSSYLRDIKNRIYNIEDYKKYKIKVDFNNPELSQNKLIEFVKEVENECPVSKAFGYPNELGEGIVWKTKYKDNIYMFKTKGEKHSVTKVKKLVEVDVEKLNSINEFVEYSVTENRFNQAKHVIFGEDYLDRRKLGDFIRWIINDIMSEELDTMKKNNLEPKDVNKYISNKIRTMFFEKENI